MIENFRRRGQFQVWCCFGLCQGKKLGSRNSKTAHYICTNLWRYKAVEAAEMTESLSRTSIAKSWVWLLVVYKSMANSATRVSLSWVRIWIKCFVCARLIRCVQKRKCLCRRGVVKVATSSWETLPNFIKIGSKLVLRQKRIFFVQFEWKKAERKRRRRQKLSLDNVWGNR